MDLKAWAAGCLLISVSCRGYTITNYVENNLEVKVGII
jgi:hypothetical protein